MKFIPLNKFGYGDNNNNKKASITWHGLWKFEHYDRNGSLIWEHEQYNDLANEGQENILNTYLRATAAPTTFYVRLVNDTPVKTDAISDLTGEPSTNGYAAQEITRDASGWGAPALDSGDYQSVSSQETFSASGGSWGPVTYAILTTSSDSSGKLIAFVALSSSRTLNDGESLKVTLTIKQV